MHSHSVSGSVCHQFEQTLCLHALRIWTPGVCFYIMQIYYEEIKPMHIYIIFLSFTKIVLNNCNPNRLISKLFRYRPNNTTSYILSVRSLVAQNASQCIFYLVVCKNCNCAVSIYAHEQKRFCITIKTQTHIAAKEISATRGICFHPNT